MTTWLVGHSLMALQFVIAQLAVSSATEGWRIPSTGVLLAVLVLGILMTDGLVRHSWSPRKPRRAAEGPPPSWVRTWCESTYSRRWPAPRHADEQRTPRTTATVEHVVGRSTAPTTPTTAVVPDPQDRSLSRVLTDER